MQNEFNEMVQSVEKYGGFYIGRYETGDISQNVAVSKKGNIDITNQNWYTHYKLNKTIAINENVATGMIWGCQWDATLRWMETKDGWYRATRGGNCFFEYNSFASSRNNTRPYDKLVGKGSRASLYIN